MKGMEEEDEEEGNGPSDFFVDIVAIEDIRVLDVHLVWIVLLPDVLHVAVVVISDDASTMDDLAGVVHYKERR